MDSSNALVGEVITADGMKKLSAVRPAMPTMAAAASQSLLNTLRSAELFEASDDATYEQLVAMGQNANALAKTLNAERLDITRPLDDLKASWMAAYAEPISIAEKIVATLRPKASAYQRKIADERAEAERAAAKLREEQERVRREAIAKADREARERADAEREEIDRQRSEAEAEAAAKLAEAVKAGNIADAVNATREADERAEQLDRVRIESEQRQRASVRQAEDDASAALRAQPVAAYVPPAPKVKGSNVVKKWVFEVRSIEALITACADALARGDRSLVRFLDSTPEIGKTVRAMGEHANIPGVVVTEDMGVTFGRGK